VVAASAGRAHGWIGPAPLVPMKWRPTLWLVALAVVLFAFIYLVERHTTPTALGPEAAPRLVSLRAGDVTNIQLRLTNRLVLQVEKSNDVWFVTVPLSYPANSGAIEGLLQRLETLTRLKHLPLEEVTADGRTIAAFGLDVPAATLTLQHAGRRTELLFGSRTPLADQVYVQLLAQPGIYVVSAEVFDRLPRSANDWRDTALLNLAGLVLDRVEVRAPGRGFAIVLDPTNRSFRLLRPTPARADGPKVETLLRRIGASRVVRFETDSPVVDLEPYGLQTPAAELVLGQGTNDLVTVQFGKSPTNDASLVYARRLSQTNIVLVPKALLELLQTSHTELRDRHLLSFVPAAVDLIEVAGDEPFTVQRQGSNTWVVAGTPSLPADAGLVLEWLDRLSRLEGNVEKDVVTDFVSYGLAPPARQYLLKAAVTNAAGGVTNRLLAQLDLGAGTGGRIFARRLDDSAVYSLEGAELAAVPVAGWQLRDRRVFNFTTNQVTGVTVRFGGQDRKLLRGPMGDWSLAPGTSGIINTFAVEELMFRLGELRAAYWTARGDAQRARLGFSDAGPKITIELKNGERPALLPLEFGGHAPTLLPYALAPVDGQPWIFEFPLKLHLELVRDLLTPLFPKSAAGQ
jgi:hypothetical protein